MAEATGERRRSGFRDLSVAWKLGTLAGVVSVLLLAIGVFGLIQLGDAQDRLDLMYNNNLRTVQNVDEVSSDYRDIRFRLRDVALAQTPAEKDAADQALRTAVEGLDTAGRRSPPAAGRAARPTGKRSSPPGRRTRTCSRRS
ncbi:hypothetical protein GCM10009827_102020 [Dactylosporangium maewongense]|uniref:Chemotaxis methyl-accepting receptor HlyB-like 4HB MCP domain-containing protein n=1 Tax=Dactylosporangium maewongense TaxID=634393 RepID=A0ABP4NNZ3_9ACTN